MCSEVHKLLHSIWNKEEIPHRGNSLSMHPFSRKAIRHIVLTIKTSLLLSTYKRLSNILLSGLPPHA